MTVIVNDHGFAPASNAIIYQNWDDLPANLAPGAAVDVPNTLTGDDLRPLLPQITHIRVPFPSSADGRGFSIARHLRLLGYTGHLRAYGHVLADQYAMARRSGFDDVEIEDALATRQPEDQWLARSNWQALDYQSRFRATA